MGAKEDWSEDRFNNCFELDKSSNHRTSKGEDKWNDHSAISGYIERAYCSVWAKPEHDLSIVAKTRADVLTRV